MELKNISAQLKEKIELHNTKTLEMCPWETADFLLKCGVALIKYIVYTNNQIEQDSEAFLSKSEIEKIDGLFRELGDNFFPMAHTTEPLRYLKIVNNREYVDVINHVESFLRATIEHCHENLTTSVATNEHNKKINNLLLNELDLIREKLRVVLNP